MSLVDFLLSVLAGAVGAAVTLAVVAGLIYLTLRHTIRRFLR